MIGDWRNNQEDARVLKLAHILSMIKVHLLSGYDVVLPYLVTDSTHVEKFAAVSAECHADFKELLLNTEKEVAVRKLLQRGSWGEEGLPPVTQEHTERIEGLYDLMITEFEKRPNMRALKYQEDDIEATYSNFLQMIVK
jgi:hypothetical protein